MQYAILCNKKGKNIKINTIVFALFVLNLRRTLESLSGQWSWR